MHEQRARGKRPRSAGKGQRAQKGTRQDPSTGRRHVYGVMGPMERAFRVLGGADGVVATEDGREEVLSYVFSHEYSDLMELAGTLQQYALGRALLQLRERLDTLEAQAPSTRLDPSGVGEAS